MSGTWILQSNPKLYDIDGALAARPVIYWRVPQFFDQPAEGDRATRAYLPKQEVGAVLTKHRIITAPMGTVFRLDTDELAALTPMLNARGSELGRPPDAGHDLLPVLPEPLAEAPPKPKEIDGRAPASARITPAMFLLSSTPERPVEVTIGGPRSSNAR